MDNLQELFDAYLLTKPSAEKIRAATVMMIHVGKALNVATQEEVTHEYYDDLIGAIDDFFVKNPQKATLDKAILAEMIGRIGPKGKLKRVFRILLNDPDENVSQYTLASLEYACEKQPKTVLDYAAMYRHSENEGMKMISIELVAKLICQGKHKTVLPQFKLWCEEQDGVYVAEVLKRIKEMNDQGTCRKGFKELQEWSRENCKNRWDEIFSANKSG